MRTANVTHASWLMTGSVLGIGYWRVFYEVNRGRVINVTDSAIKFTQTRGQ